MTNEIERADNLAESIYDDIEYIDDLSDSLDDLGDVAEDYLQTLDRYYKSAARTKALLREANKYL